MQHIWEMTETLGTKGLFESFLQMKKFPEKVYCEENMTHMRRQTVLSGTCRDNWQLL